LKNLYFGNSSECGEHNKKNKKTVTGDLVTNGASSDIEAIEPDEQKQRTIT
jgi:hypothetical protein